MRSKATKRINPGSSKKGTIKPGLLHSNRSSRTTNNNNVPSNRTSKSNSSKCSNNRSRIRTTNNNEPSNRTSKSSSSKCSNNRSRSRTNSNNNVPSNRTKQKQQQQVQQQKQDQNRQQQQQQQQRAQQQQRPQRTQEQQRVEQSTWQNHRSGNWQSDHRNWQQRGGYNGYRIPQDRYRGYFGSQHYFRIFGLPFMVYNGYPRFQYEGYWITLLDPWPNYWSNDWYDNDDVYIAYGNDGYYMYNRRYPGIGIAISISM